MSPTLAKRLHLRDRNHQHTSSDTANLCISLGRVTAVAGSRHLPVAGALVGVCKAACAVDESSGCRLCEAAGALPLQALCDDWSLSTCHSSQLCGETPSEFQVHSAYCFAFLSVQLFCGGRGPALKNFRKSLGTSAKHI